MVLETCENSGDILEEERKTNPAQEPDLKPEFCHYKDEGCEYAAACLECPYPQCLYDEPGGKQRWLKESRNQEINKLFVSGWKIKELALLFDVSQRTIQRALKEKPYDK
jgi:hypothetical protein